MAHPRLPHQILSEVDMLTEEEIIKAGSSRDYGGWITTIRRLSSVRRCGTLRTIAPQSVAEHSYYVTLIAWEIGLNLQSLGWELDLNSVVKMALFHDAEEAIMGDIPYPVKRASEELRNSLKLVKREILEKFFDRKVNNVITQLESGKFKMEREAQIVSAADYVELYLYCSEEMQLGNRSQELQNIMYQCQQIIKKKICVSSSMLEFDGALSYSCDMIMDACYRQHYFSVNRAMIETDLEEV